MPSLTLEEWDRLLRIGRLTGVLGRVAASAHEEKLLESLPVCVQPHLRAAMLLSEAHQRAIRWELNRIHRALAPTGTPVILLKGAAYLAAGLPTARGRLHRDVDLLVPRPHLDTVERSLLEHGWKVGEDNRLHELYFRKWLHELPPLKHRLRRTVLDVHHTILPHTDTLRVDPQLLWSSATPLPETGFQILAPADMVLHCAAHLFRNGDFTRCLRDLCDLESLLRTFLRDERFAETLIERAMRLDLGIPLFYGLRYVEELFGTSIPDALREGMQRWEPMKAKLHLVDALVISALWPRRTDRRNPLRSLAVAALSYWPIPRPRAMLSPLFWTKRIPAGIIRKRRLDNEPDFEQA